MEIRRANVLILISFSINTEVQSFLISKFLQSVLRIISESVASKFYSRGITYGKHVTTQNFFGKSDTKEK